MRGPQSRNLQQPRRYATKPHQVAFLGARFRAPILQAIPRPVRGRAAAEKLLSGAASIPCFILRSKPRTNFFELHEQTHNRVVEFQLSVVSILIGPSAANQRRGALGIKRRKQVAL